MKLVKIKLDGGTEIEVSEEVAEKIKADQKARVDADAKAKADADAKAKADADKADADAKAKAKADADKKPDPVAMQAKLDAQAAEIDALRTAQPDRIDARVKLVRAADVILGTEHKTDGVCDAEIMRAIVEKVSPTLKDKLDAHKTEPAYLQCAYDAALELHEQRAKNVDETNAAIFGAYVANGDSGNKNDIDDCLKTIGDFYTKRSNPIAAEKTANAGE